MKANRIIQKFNAAEDGVAYIIAYVLLAMFVMGMLYATMSDVRDMITPLYSTLSVQAGFLNDSDSQYGFDFLNLLFSFFIVFFIFGLLWWMWQYSQKPEQPF